MGKELLIFENTNYFVTARFCRKFMLWKWSRADPLFPSGLTLTNNIECV